jgi:hypothetical protein
MSDGAHLGLVAVLLYEAVSRDPVVEIGGGLRVLSFR